MTDGAADGNIPTGSSLVYRDRMISKMGDAAAESYRYYQVDGLHHCEGGVGPVNCGSISLLPTVTLSNVLLYLVGQSDANTLYPLDAKYDILGAIVAWVVCELSFPLPVISLKSVCAGKWYSARLPHRCNVQR